ncbi:MAG: winged helix-turn-helix domain-containing protein [Candidatus Bathyarchaeota archaeon]|jgi:DNA-binding transcriptional ArsR family regulator|nr:winged helix-turn-helix domain-containing protein [Candidatus Bathyarchaeota archaeon]MDD4325372.1 winged helix-turn-helix domain-containing protein [Candidatus Bathyarchaeota archaeon]NLD65353.1 winged helix-turn-helix transcriptional regulator [Thermoproteota archaeon]
MPIEDVFSSKTRMKILKLIYTLGSLNVSDIARRIRINYVTTMQHLKILEAEGILTKHVYGRIQMYRFKDGPKAKAIADLIEIWEEP